MENLRPDYCLWEDPEGDEHELELWIEDFPITEEEADELRRSV